MNTVSAQDYAAYNARKKAHHRRVAKKVEAIETEIESLAAKIQEIQGSCEHYLTSYLRNGWHQCGACGKII